MRLVLYQVYYTKNQFLCYLWEMKPIIKRCIVSLYYFCDCTYFHTYLLIPCKKMLPNVNCKFLQSHSYKIAQILSGDIAHYDPCKKLLKKGKTEPSFLMGEAMGLLIYNEKICLVYISKSDQYRL